ncbi:DctP family TRAP transporter solute-binding subunit [Halobacillus sp. SY10]|uniref:DctP family TRAP transporter solute-binding subunit n=1 Tax=Halobacillus sp. SY10 TaxID=3381356 RepID=UPI003879F0C4
MLTALYFGFDFSEASETLEYDDEQEGINDEIVIKFSHVVAENTPKARAARKFASLVETRSNGEIKVEIYANGSLYNDQNEYAALKEGHIEMIAPATSKMTAHDPGWQVLDLPYAFSTYDDVKKAYEGELGDRLFDHLDSDIRGMTYWYNGFKQITNDKRPLLLPEDFKRTHFRIMPSPMIQTQFKALGASTSEIPFNKTYSNLEVGFIDGQENTASNIFSKKLYEEQKYMTISNHGYLGYVVLMNNDFWEGLSKEHQMIITNALDETTAWVWRHAIEMNDSHLRQMKRMDFMEIHYLSNEQKERWKKKFKSIYQNTDISQSLMEELKRIQEK